MSRILSIFVVEIRYKNVGCQLLDWIARYEDEGSTLTLITKTNISHAEYSETFAAGGM